MRVPVVRLEDLPIGATAAFEVEVDGAREGALVVRLASGELRAYVNRCRHASLPLDWGDARFLDEQGRIACRAHGARYSPEDGLCVDGPCPGLKLRPIKLEVQDGVVYATEVAARAGKPAGSA